MMATTPPEGVTLLEGVVTTPIVLAWLGRLRRHVPTEIPIVVTSGTRTAREQAVVMIKKWALAEQKNGPGGGDKELRAIYGRKASLLLSLPRDSDVWAAQIEALARGGTLFSRHLLADAIDLRTRTLTATQTRILVDAAAYLGAHTLLETIPPHLHLDRIAAAMGQPEPPIRVTRAPGLAGTGVILLLLAAAGAAAGGSS